MQNYFVSGRVGGAVWTRDHRIHGGRDPCGRVRAGCFARDNKDGKTGFLVNPSESDMRGDFVIKRDWSRRTQEAVERIYELSDEDYKTMRWACRQHIEEKFTLETMVIRI